MIRHNPRESVCPPALAAEAPKPFDELQTLNQRRLSAVGDYEDTQAADPIKEDEAHSAPSAGTGNRAAPERDALSSVEDSGVSGVILSNTPPQSSHLDNFVGAEDWLEVSFYVDWNRRWSGICEALDLCKENAASDEPVPESNQYEVSGFGPVSVDRMGARLGDGRKAPYMDFKLTTADGLVFLVSKRFEAHANIPSAVVRICGEYCLGFGAFHGYESAQLLIKNLGGYIKRNRLSRVDLCLDMPGVSMESFVLAYKDERYLVRSKFHSLYVSNGASVGFGSSASVCRIYDKKAETKAKANPLKKSLMIINRWGGTMPACATRVEFQLRREFLKKRSVDSVESYFEVRSDLINYLTHSWLRFSKTPIDRKNKNQSRIELLPLWISVQEAFRHWAGLPAGLPLVPIDREAVDISQLIKQAAGVLYSAAVFKGKTIESWQDFLDFSLPLMERVMRMKHNLT